MDNETLEAEQFAHPKVQTKCAAQERLCGRGHLLQPSSPPSPSRLSAALVRGAVTWSRPQGGGTWRRQRLAQTETGAQRLAQTGTETGAQRLAQTETGAISGDLLSFLNLAKSVYKAAIAQVEWCGGEPMKAWLGRRQGGSKTALHCQG